jgi:hypothetical protein
MMLRIAIVAVLLFIAPVGAQSGYTDQDRPVWMSDIDVGAGAMPPIP